MAIHSSVLAWRIPGTGEPGRLPSMGLHRVGHNWSDLAAAAAAGKFKKFSTVKSITVISHSITIHSPLLFQEYTSEIYDLKMLTPWWVPTEQYNLVVKVIGLRIRKTWFLILPYHLLSLGNEKNQWKENDINNIKLLWGLNVIYHVD